MCGPADYDALQTCILRMMEVSAAGLTTYALHQTVRHFGASRKGRSKLPESPLTADAAGVPAEVTCDGYDPR